MATGNGARLLTIPLCMADPFSEEFLRCHGTNQQTLLSPETIATLAAMATLAKVEISGVEIGHARWQQDSRIRSVRTSGCSSLHECQLCPLSGTAEHVRPSNKSQQPQEEAVSSSQPQAAMALKRA